MATYRAIEEACTAVASALDDAPRPPELSGHGLEFRVVDAGALTRGLRKGAGVLPYRVRVVNGSLPPRGPGGAPAPLAVEVQLIVVVAADDPATRLTLTGWVLRTLHDQPVLLEGTVRIAVDDMPRQELLQVWDSLGLRGRDALPLPYVLSGLLIDSARNP